MSRNRPRIPRLVARQLRQEAGFGCCRCGLPILDYHHIVPYHEDDPYSPAEMMALCPLCHDAATKGALVAVDQRAMKTNPYNIQHGFVEGQLRMNQAYSAVQVGGNILVSDRAVVSIDSQTLLALAVDDRAHLLLSISLCDQRYVARAYREQRLDIR